MDPDYLHQFRSQCQMKFALNFVILGSLSELHGCMMNQVAAANFQLKTQFLSQLYLMIRVLSEQVGQSVS